jgi:hypothetical protein
MNGKNAVLFVLVILFLLIAGCKPDETPSLTASLSELSGKVDTKMAGQENFTPATANTVLEVNGQVQTGDDGRVRLDLSSGTIIRVGPSSLFTLVSNDPVEGGLATKIKLEIGKIFIILNGGSADVETPSGVASVRGSYMKVEVDPETGDVYVTCLEGDCSASNPAGTINFTNGQRVILFRRDPVTGNWTAPNAEPMTPEEFQEWLDENPEARELFEQAMATLTALANPTEATEEPTEQPTPTPQGNEPSNSSGGGAGGGEGGCFGIIQPPGGASLPKQGQVTFEWESQSGAQTYVITFIDSNGRRAVIETTNTSASHYIEIFPAGGSYSWFVTAYDANGNEICSTPASSFSKPQGDPTPKPEPEPEEEQEEESSCTEEDLCNPESPCFDEVYYYEYCMPSQ